MAHRHRRAPLSPSLPSSQNSKRARPSPDGVESPGTSEEEQEIVHLITHLRRRTNPPERPAHICDPSFCGIVSGRACLGCVSCAR